MDLAERNYIGALIDRAEHETNTACVVAGSFDLDAIVERLTWAMEFLDGARAKLESLGRNPDGTAGPEHVTSEGVELGPPKR